MLASRRPRWPAVETTWARDLRCGAANRPRVPVHTYHRDGVMRFDGNCGGAVNYEPNSFGGPVIATAYHTLTPLLGTDATNALVISQVVLSLALPFPMIALVLFARRGGIMGRFANGGLTHAAAIAGTILVLSLNALLVLQTFGVAIPGLPGAG